VEELEDRLSVYRDHSEIMRLNRTAAFEAAPVDAELFALLQQCDRLYQQTAGAFDATTGPLSRVWGFFERKGRLPGDGELAEALDLVGWRHVQLDPDAQTMRLLKPGVEVNFNGIGKGYALDRAAELMQEDGVADLLMHGGRSTLVARGNRPPIEVDGVEGDRPGWGVGLRHPIRPQHHIAEFNLVDGAFSTSGSATQGFVHQGQRYGHILDPRTGRPALGMHSVSVVAPTGAEADALSTAFFVMGFEASAEYCRQNPGVGALFVLPGAQPSTVEIRPVNLPDDRWRQLAKG
jgi:thiamine biosynthesis lipoprotein